MEDDYRNWRNKKVFLAAPTGMGKTTFIINVLLPYFRGLRQKMLILCNRKLLRQQYWFDLVRDYVCYEDLRACAEIKTYQEVALEAKKGACTEELFKEYAVVVCDEVHYFYFDSDFNGFGTYALLQIIIHAGMAKEIIFMTATMDEVKPIIIKTIRNCFTKRRLRTGEWKSYEGYDDVIEKDYSMYADYDRFTCIAIPDEETLCSILVSSSAKTVAFIDNKEKGNDLVQRMLDTKKVERNQIAVLNADNIDETINSEVVRNLTIAHRVLPKILITTSVLDNGVSIHDPDVENIVIVTESRISFLQMLGRIRSEEGKKCRLYFLVRNENVFLQRMNRYKQECDRFDELSKENFQENRYHYIQAVWDGQEEVAEFYRKALVWMRHEDFCFSVSSDKVELNRKGYDLQLNECARVKCGGMYLAESRFYSLAVSDPLQVIYEQMSWIGKEPGELHVEGSRYLERCWNQLKTELLTVHTFDNKQLQELKRSLVKKYRNPLFLDIPAQNGTIATEKLEIICSRCGLKISVSEDSERRKRYSIVEADSKEGRENEK